MMGEHSLIDTETNVCVATKDGKSEQWKCLMDISKAGTSEITVKKEWLDSIVTKSYVT